MRSFTYGLSTFYSIFYLFLFVIPNQLIGEELVKSDFLNKEGGYSCNFKVGYELTPVGITKKKGGSFTFIRTSDGLFFNEINDIIGYYELNVQIWNWKDSFRFVNDRGTANFFYNNGMFFYADTHITSIFSAAGFCGKIDKSLIF